MTTNTKTIESILMGALYALVAGAGLLVAGSVVWWSFANTETWLGGAFVSALLLIPAAALYSVIATPVAALLGVLAAAIAAFTGSRA